jgi:[acyl-carrier-protein] S-malonyltransferase
MTLALVFPGQGSQAVGMGRDLAEAFVVAKHLLAEVDDALSQNLSRLMFEGPEQELVLTENAQPALMACSIAALRVMEQGGFDVPNKVAYVAGHSLGEYTALAAVKTFGVGGAARLLKTRGKAMQAAVPVGAGAMAALLGIELDAARKVSAEAAQGEVCSVANDNGGGQVVVSGTKAAVERAIAIAKDHGVKRGIMLPVSAPFHCALMAPAAKAMDEALAATTLNRPAVPLVPNVSVEATSDAKVIRRLLVEQVTATVRWRETILFLRDHGVTTLVEVGAGKVLTGLAKRVAPDLKGINVASPADVDSFFKAI